MYRSERELSEAVMRQLKNIPGLFARRVESGQTGSGFPDIFAADRQGSIWIELKHGKPKFRPGQEAWAYEYFRMTGNPVWVVYDDAAGIHLKADSLDETFASVRAAIEKIFFCRNSKN